MTREYAHTCRDEHHEIGFNDPEDKYGELCPMCMLRFEAQELYEALENLYGDVFLLGMCEIKLEDIYEGSQHGAIKVLKRLQQHRSEELTTQAIGQKPVAAPADAV